MTDSMIERVARSICRESGAICVMDEDPARPACTRKNCENISLARAAIQAMRTPTEAMLEAGADPVLKLTQADGARTTGWGCSAAAIVYQTVIDAALKEKP